MPSAREGPLQSRGRASGTKGVHCILIGALIVAATELRAAVEDAQQRELLLLEERRTRSLSKSAAVVAIFAVYSFAAAYFEYVSMNVCW